MGYRTVTDDELLTQAKEVLEKEAKECEIDIANGVSTEKLQEKYGYDFI